MGAGWRTTTQGARRDSSPAAQNDSVGAAPREWARGGARRNVHREILRLRLRMTAWGRRLVNERGASWHGAGRRGATWGVCGNSCGNSCLRLILRRLRDAGVIFIGYRAILIRAAQNALGI